MTNSTIGLIGLGVMGQNLALNIERNGYPTAVFDRESPVKSSFETSHYQWFDCNDPARRHRVTALTSSQCNSYRSTQHLT